MAPACRSPAAAAALFCPQAALHRRLSQRFATLHARVPPAAPSAPRGARWLEPELLGAPPLVSVLGVAEEERSSSTAGAGRCPSPEMPQCWLHPDEVRTRALQAVTHQRVPPAHRAAPGLTPTRGCAAGRAGGGRPAGGLRHLPRAQQRGVGVPPHAADDGDAAGGGRGGLRRRPAVPLHAGRAAGCGGARPPPPLLLLSLLLLMLLISFLPCSGSRFCLRFTSYCS